MCSCPERQRAAQDRRTTTIDPPVRRQLETRKKRIDQIYFVESGFASVVADGNDKAGIEVGIIGREGMTGLGIVLGGERAAHDTFIQAAGKGQRIRTAHLRDSIDQSVTLHRSMLRY